MINTLGLALQQLRPDADPTRDYMVQDDGRGPRLVRWNSETLGPPPDTAAIEAAMLAVERSAYAEQRRREYERRGVTYDAIMEALIEHAGGRSEKLLALMAVRDEVRAQFPKP